MTESNRDRVLRVLVDGHAQLAAFARESYRLDGRGVIRVTIPPPPPGIPPGSVATTDMVYHVVEQIRTLTAHFTGTQRADADDLLRMLDTYDPSTQAVVMVAFDDQRKDPPISVKMRLDVPVIVDEPGGVH
jgi:hypothetical protein